MFLSDIDGTMAHAKNFSLRGVKEASSKLRSFGIPLFIVTSKTLEASLMYYEEVGRPGYKGGPAIAFELGCALASKPDIMTEYDYVDRSTGLAIFELCRSVYTDLRGANYIVPDRCRDIFLDVSNVDENLINVMTGLPLKEASLIKKRRYIMSLIVKRQDRTCIKRLIDEIASRGLNVVTGPRFIHIYDGKGKLGVIEALGRIFPDLRNCIIAYAGDTITDKEALERADLAFVMPQPDYRLKVRPQRSDYIIPPYPAPEGWAWVVDKLISYLDVLSVEE